MSSTAHFWTFAAMLSSNKLSQCCSAAAVAAVAAFPSILLTRADRFFLKEAPQLDLLLLLLLLNCSLLLLLLLLLVACWSPSSFASKVFSSLQQVGQQ
jgi:hypothetical protein